MPEIIFLLALNHPANDERFSLTANRSTLCVAMATVISVAVLLKKRRNQTKGFLSKVAKSVIVMDRNGHASSCCLSQGHNRDIILNKRSKSIRFRYKSGLCDVRQSRLVFHEEAGLKRAASRAWSCKAVSGEV